MRKPNKYSLAVVITVLFAPPACGQLLDTLLPATVPGYGEKFSVIAQHRAVAPGATRWNFGGITAAPGLDMRTGYDSAPGGAAGSALLQATPSLSVADQAAGFGLYAQAMQADYPQNRAQNTGTTLIAAGERISLPRERITAAAAWLRGAVTGFAFDTAAITRPIPFTLENFRAADEFSSGMFTFTPEFSASRYRFGAIASTASRDEWREAATLASHTGGPLTLLLRLGATQQIYQTDAENADVFEYLAGAREQADGLWSLSLLAGAAQRLPRFGPAITAPILEARADWMPTALTRISLTASREIDDPDAVSAAPYTKTSLKLAVVQDHLGNVTIKALADLAEARYIHSNLREFLGMGELSMQWRATPVLSVTGVYSFNTRQANALGAANEHVFTLGLSWTP